MWNHGKMACLEWPASAVPVAVQTVVNSLYNHANVSTITTKPQSTFLRLKQHLNFPYTVYPNIYYISGTHSMFSSMTWEKRWVTLTQHIPNNHRTSPKRLRNVFRWAVVFNLSSGAPKSDFYRARIRGLFVFNFPLVRWTIDDLVVYSSVLDS